MPLSPRRWKAGWFPKGLIPSPLVALAFIGALVVAGSGASSHTLPPGNAETMMAVVVDEFGLPEVLRVREVAKPEPGEGELLLRVQAAGVNPVDASIRSGQAAGMVGAELPYVPGFDVSGVVERVGPGVERFEPGDQVFAMMDLRRGGGYAEYALVKTEEAAPRPIGTSHAEAASLPLVALTGWQALFRTAKLEAGQEVLIHGGAGGVGSIAVQLAKWRGARIIATASPRNHDFLRELGADVVVDYNTERFEDHARDVDVVLDPIGGDTQIRSLEVLREGGTLVSLVGLTAEARSPPQGVEATAILVQPDSAQLSRIAELVEGGTVRPVVTHRLPLHQAPDAHQQSETGHTRGKIVLEVGGSAPASSNSLFRMRSPEPTSERRPWRPKPGASCLM